MRLNPYSQRCLRAKACWLAGILETGLIDPYSLELIGEAWIADMVGDREDTRAVLDVLQESIVLAIKPT